MKTASPIYIAAGDTSRNSARSGIQITVRSLVRELGQRHADRARVAYWNRHRHCLHLLPPDFSLGLSAESLRASPPLTLAQRLAALPGWMPWRDDARIPLHRHPRHTRELAGAWLLLPELLRGERRIDEFVAYARRRQMRLAAIFYDAIPLQYPEFSPPESIDLHRRYMRGLAQFDLILPISETSAEAWRKFVQTEQLPSPKIQVVPLAAEIPRIPRATHAPAAHGGKPLALCVSTVEPRKNHRTLCAALDALDLPGGALPFEIDLVGRPDRAAPELDAFVAAAEGRFGGRLRWHRRVDAGYLRHFYSHCDFTVYPSISEGFGLPILESLWFGRPCITANFGVMAEHARGGGCLTADVRDPAALADAMRKLATDPDLRRRLSDEAIKRPLKTWREYADDIVRALDEA